MVMMTLRFKLEYLFKKLQCEEEQDNSTREWESTSKATAAKQHNS